jgi:hypothetical protein
MGILSGYTSLEVLKARLGISDGTDDAALEAVITAVSRAIDDYCGRRFYAASETRYFTARHGDRLMVDDLLSVTSLATDDDGDRTYETVWAATDYDLEPANAALDGEPYWEIRAAPEGRYSFPSTSRGVKIVGSFGFAATTPAVIEEATLAQCKLVFDARNSVSGVEGGSVNPSVTVSLHPFVRTLLNPYRRISVG